MRLKILVLSILLTLMPSFAMGQNLNESCQILSPDDHTQIIMELQKQAKELSQQAIERHINVTERTLKNMIVALQLMIENGDFSGDSKESIQLAADCLDQIDRLSVIESVTQSAIEITENFKEPSSIAELVEQLSYTARLTRDDGENGAEKTLRTTIQIILDGEENIYSLENNFYIELSRGSKDNPLVPAKSSIELVMDVAKSDARGAISGGVAGCAAGSIGAGVGCLPGAGAGAVSAAIGNSALEVIEQSIRNFFPW